MKKVFLSMLFTTGLVTNSYAEGTVNYLQVEDNTVTFGISGDKSLTSPDCMAAENTELWSASLATQTGRAMYAMLVSAMVTSDTLEVISAGDCDDIDGVERAKSISMDSLSDTNTSSTESKGIGIYKGDDVTRVGTLAQIIDKDSWYYVDTESVREVKQLTSPLEINSTFYFYTADCSGLPFGFNSYVNGETIDSETLFYSPSIADGLIYKAEGTTSKYTGEVSIAQLDGTCRGATHFNGLNYTGIDATAHPICGDTACVVRED